MTQTSPEDLALRIQSLALSPNFNQKEIKTVIDGAATVRYLSSSLANAKGKIVELQAQIEKEGKENAGIIQDLKRNLQNVLIAYDDLIKIIGALASQRSSSVEEARNAIGK